MKSGIFQILVGIDFSDSSAAAMYQAQALAERLGAVMHLCHINPLNANLAAPTDLGLNVPSHFQDAQQARERLERLRAMLGSKISVEVHLRMGDPVRGMLDLVSEVHPDMVVVGSHGYGAVMRLLMGSVSTQLTRLSPVPVLVVPSPDRMVAAKLTPAPEIEPALPSVGQSVGDRLDLNRTNDSSSGSVNVSPAGVGGYDVNPELRVRY